MPRDKAFTGEQGDEIVAAYLEGATIDQLAEIYSCSVTPVRRVLLDAGVTLRPTGRPWPYDEPTERRLVQDYAEGATIRELAQRERPDRAEGDREGGRHHSANGADTTALRSRRACSRF